MENRYGRVKAACYTSNVAMSVVGNLSPLLFLTFRSLYGLSYSLLGLLVLINFCTQLGIDLIFSFFSHKFNIPATVKTMPLLTVAGLLVYGVWPWLFPDSVYGGLVLGTVLFSASGGLGEVLISPVIAAIPSKDPDRAMSRLHSVYAWGVVGVILVTTLFLLVFGAENWQWLALLFVLIPLVAFGLYAGADIPPMKTEERVSGVLRQLRQPGLWACVACIFFGGAAECTMAQWASGYLEQALAIPKVWGDVFGVALFSVMLGLGRSLYGKRGRYIGRVLTLSAVGAVVCYLTAALCRQPVVGLLACGLTGFCAAMMWPGSLVVATERFPAGGVFIFALMAAGGDLGASVGPQLVGIITDGVMASPAAARLAADWALTPEQLGMKLGILIGMLFPLCALPLFAAVWKRQKQKQ
ncbi:MAG: MFS transporter [Clostridia bacterium]|nr:MFS transporter [Clostridia bacterium]